MAYTDPTTAELITDLLGTDNVVRQMTVSVSGDGAQGIQNAHGWTDAAADNNSIAHLEWSLANRWASWNSPTLSGFDLTVYHYDSQTGTYSQKGDTIHISNTSSSGQPITLSASEIGSWLMSELYSDGDYTQTPVAVKVDMTATAYIKPLFGSNLTAEITASGFLHLVNGTLPTPGSVTNYEIYSMQYGLPDPTQPYYTISSILGGYGYDVYTYSRIRYKKTYEYYPPIIGDPIFFGN